MSSQSTQVVVDDRPAICWRIRFHPGQLKPAALALALAGAFAAPAIRSQSLPTGGVAIHGAASIATPAANQLVVTTQNGAGTGHSAINWQSFSISAGSSARFDQPSAGSLSINRVVTNTPSAIFGNLSSNGRLVLVNQSGITVGAGAVIDSAGFTASALRMTDADALAGRLRFGDAAASMGGAAGITVDGRITARNGDVVLVAPQIGIGTSALLQAPNGSTILAAGQQVEITGRGLEGISLLVQARDNEARNLGRLEGDAVGIFAGTLRHSGEIQATTASLDGGRVVLRAKDDNHLDGNSNIVAIGNHGGKVDVFGERVAVSGHALVDVSGTQGGGQIRIGGDFQGKNPAVPNAQRTYVGRDTGLRADAMDNGDGGRIIVWSDDLTHAYGNIRARGGALGGNGGFVEVSGKHGLGFDATVDTLAARGRTGTLLLDPDNIDIQATGGAILTDVDQFADGGSASLVIAAATINAAAANVVLQANNNITFSAPIAMTNAGVGITAQAGFYVTVDPGATITTRGGAVSLLAGDLGSLTSPSESAVFLNAAIDTTNGGSVPGGANVTIKSRLQDLGTSSVELNANINAGTGGSVLLDAFTSLVAGGRINQTGGVITALNLTALALEEVNLAQNNVITGDVNLSSNLGAGSGGFINFRNLAGSFNLSGATAKGNVTITSGGLMSTGGVIQSTTGNVSITTSGDLSFGDDVSAAGTLTLISGGGLMSQSSGSITAGGASIFNAGGNDVLFGSITNDFTTVAVTGGQITLVDATGLTISSRTQPINGNLYLEARTGALILPAGAIDTGTSQLSLLSGAGAFTTPGTLNGSDLLLRGITSLTLAHNISASGNITLLSSGNMTQSAGTVTSSAGAMNIAATGTLTIQGGAGSPTAMVSTGNQTINAGNIQVLGGAGGSNASAAIKMLGAAATQDITASNGITIAGGANGGGVGVGNYGSIASNGNQFIAVGNGGLTLTAGSGTGAETGNSANLEHNGSSGTSQTITINGTGFITATAGSSALTGMSEQDASRASIRSDSGDSQTITFTGGGAGRAITLTGGTVGTDAYAEIYAGLGTQSITGAGLITLTGGASGGGPTIGPGNTTGNEAVIVANTNNQSIAANGIVLQGGAGGSNNFAMLIAGGSQAITVDSGGLTLNGGNGGAGENKNAAAVLKTNDIAAAGQTITVSGGGAITLLGGSSSDTTVGYDANLLGLSNGSFAMVRSDGASQLIEFTAPGGSISMTGGTLGGNNLAFIQAMTGSQTIRGSSAANAPTITLKGGASGGVTTEGNRAVITAETGNQSISAAAIALQGGDAGTESIAQIRQGDPTNGLTATQTVTIVNNGNLSIKGGIGATGVTNLARIQSSGVTQTVALGASGTLDLMGGTGTGFNFARIEAINGDQFITGSGNITITGGASGGSTGNGNFADLRQRNVAKQQSVTANILTITGGASGVENNAVIRGEGIQSVSATGIVIQGGVNGTDNYGQINAMTSSQAINIGTGGLSLTGGGGNSTDRRNYASLFQGGLAGTTQTVTVSGGSNITLQGGSSAGTTVGTDNGSLAFIKIGRAHV